MSSDAKTPEQGRALVVSLITASVSEVDAMPYQYGYVVCSESDFTPVRIRENRFALAGGEIAVLPVAQARKLAANFTRQWQDANGGETRHFKFMPFSHWRLAYTEHYRAMLARIQSGTV